MQTVSRAGRFGLTCFCLQPDTAPLVDVDRAIAVILHALVGVVSVVVGGGIGLHDRCSVNVTSPNSTRTA